MGAGRRITRVGVGEGEAVPQPQRGVTGGLALAAEAVAARRLEFLGRGQDQPFRRPAPDRVKVTFDLDTHLVLSFKVAGHSVYLPLILK